MKFFRGKKKHTYNARKQSNRPNHTQKSIKESHSPTCKDTISTGSRKSHLSLAAIFQSLYSTAISQHRSRIFFVQNTHKNPRHLLQSNRTSSTDRNDVRNCLISGWRFRDVLSCFELARGLYRSFQATKKNYSGE